MLLTNVFSVSDIFASADRLSIWFSSTVWLSSFTLVLLFSADLSSLFTWANSALSCIASVSSVILGVSVFSTNVPSFLGTLKEATLLSWLSTGASAGLVVGCASLRVLS